MLINRVLLIKWNVSIIKKKKNKIYMGKCWLHNTAEHISFNFQHKAMLPFLVLDQTLRQTFRSTWFHSTHTLTTHTWTWCQQTRHVTRCSSTRTNTVPHPLRSGSKDPERMISGHHCQVRGKIENLLCFDPVVKNLYEARPEVEVWAHPVLI